MSKKIHFFLIRGLIRESAHWGPFQTFLKEEFADSNITTIDLPGAGENFRQNSPCAMADIIEHMRKKFLSHYLPGEVCVLISISMGGMVAGTWMKNYPDDFSMAVLINSSFSGISPFYHRLRPAALLYLLPVLFMEGRRREEWILKLVSNQDPLCEKTIDDWTRIQAERPVTLINSLRQLIAAANCNIGNFIPRIPILLLASVNDRMVNVECSRSLSQKWKVSYQEHPSAGHDLSDDDPLWLIDQLKGFCVH